MDEPIRITGYWRENFRRSLRDWDGKELVAGVLVILLTAFGYGLLVKDPDVIKWAPIGAVAYFFVLVLVVSPWQMWRDSQREIVGYRESLRPHISFIFEPDVPPYLQFFFLHTQGHIDRRIRMYRVGIRNDSSVVIKKVRVVVESAAYIVDGNPVRPTPAQPVLVEHALNVMGIDKQSGMVDLSPGDRPGAYVDVIEQATLEGQEPQEIVSLCYATRHRTMMDARGKWILTLRVEGGGYYSRARFVVDGSGADKATKMTPFALG